jgi:hypothetical protein
MLWGAVFFTFTESEGDYELTDKYELLGHVVVTNVLAVLIVVFNIIFISWNVWLALVAFNNKENITKKMYQKIKKIQQRTSEYWSNRSKKGSESDTRHTSSTKSPSIGFGIYKPDINIVDYSGSTGGTVGNNVMIDNPMPIVDRKKRRGLMRSQKNHKEGNQIELTIITERDSQDFGISVGEPSPSTIDDHSGSSSGGGSSSSNGSSNEGEKLDEVNGYFNNDHMRVYDFGEDRWIAAFDVITNHQYYYCERTGESRWDPPWE